MVIISVDSDDEEAAVRGALREAGLSFTIRRGHVYLGSGCGSSGSVTISGGSESVRVHFGGGGYVPPEPPAIP